MTVLSPESEHGHGLARALRQVRDPLLLVALPVAFAFLLIDVGYAPYMPLGFDFRGTLWEPARAFLDGKSIYPPPTQEAVVVGNPSVYPPAFVLASIPLALLPFTIATSVWIAMLGASVVLALWIVGLRDWRCFVLALSSPPVVHGLFYGNLTLLLLLPVAVAWRYRDRAEVAGIAVGAAIAAKLFLGPLVLWLLLTRRYRAVGWAAGSSLAIALTAWIVIGFGGLADYPALLQAVQDVYAVRSTSFSTVAGGLGASVSQAVVLGAAAGVALLAGAAWLVRRADGDERAFAIALAACIVASPIVWPNYLALLFVPIAIVWPRLGPMWFFGYFVWLAGVVAPPVRVPEDVCCKPDGVPNLVWAWSHQEPAPWFAGGVMVVVMVVVAACVADRGSFTRRDVRPLSGLPADR